MTSGKDDEEFFRQRGFGIKIGFGERPALMIIDMIKGFTDPSMPLGAPLESQIEAQRPLLELAHQRDIPVIFSTVIYEEEDIKDAGVWALKQIGRAHAHRRFGSRQDRSPARLAAQGYCADEEVRLVLLRHRPGGAPQ